MAAWETKFPSADHSPEKMGRAESIFIEEAIVVLDDGVSLSSKV
jgi:hypothetical protein